MQRFMLLAVVTMTAAYTVPRTFARRRATAPVMAESELNSDFNIGDNGLEIKGKAYQQLKQRSSSLLTDMAKLLKDCRMPSMIGLAQSCLMELKPEIKSNFDAAASDGRLDEAGLAAILAAAGDELPEEKVAAMFDETDTKKVWDKVAGVNNIVKEGSIDFDQYYELLINLAFEKKGYVKPAAKSGSDGGGFKFPWQK